MAPKLGQEVISNQTGTLVLDGKTPEEVAFKMTESGYQKEPFYIFDADKAYERIQHFKEVMPRMKIFYAMKANDSEMMLKLAIASGIGFDCASAGEIHKIKQLNVNPLSIIYAIPTKTEEQMLYARMSGVKHTTFDSSSELQKLKKYWPDACLLIRLRVDGDSAYQLGLKFGCDFETEAISLLEEAASLGLKVVGVAFHVGSACSSANSHLVGLQYARALFDYEEKKGRQMKIVDIGGGFLSDRTDRIDNVATLINSTLEDLFPDPEVQVIAEPGRYLCDSSTTLYCSISNVRRITKANQPVNMIYMNDGLFGTLRYMEPWHTVEKMRRINENDNGILEEAILWGPSCDSTDRVMQDRKIMLPPCTIEDWLVFKLQGAYSFGFASTFSCLQGPLIRSVISIDLWNNVKDSPVFGAEDFTLNPDIAAPLPSTIPKVLLEEETKITSKTPVLI